MNHLIKLRILIVQSHQMIIQIQKGTGQETGGGSSSGSQGSASSGGGAGS